MQLRSIFQNPAFLLVLITSSFLIENCRGANILFFYVMTTYSHRTAIEPLAHELVARGHNVTFLTAVKPQKSNPKFREFLPKSVEEFSKVKLGSTGDDAFPQRLKDKKANFLVEVDLHLSYQIMGCELFFQSPEFRDWFETNHFDLFFLAHGANKCAYSFAHQANAPVVVVSASSFFMSEEDAWGFPLESSWHRRFAVRNVFTDEMTFYDKAYNALNALLYDQYAKWIVYPRMDAMIREYFEDPNFPRVEDMERENTALFMMNQHFAEDYPRSLPPMVIPVGGMHCTEERKPLPKNPEAFIAGAGDAGFVFVSFGSMLKMSQVPGDFREMLFDAIKDMKTRFLWRWDSNPPPNLPPNILADKWFPQQDLLADPRIRGFVSHGGLMSTQQGIFHAVPLLIIPLVYDQPYNALKVRQHGIGLHLELSDLTTANFKDAVHRIIHDRSLKEKMKLVSRRFRDRPMSAVDTAAYWTEYVLRHKDTSHLKPLGIHQTWWERRLLDVWAFVFTLILLIMYILYKVISLIVRVVLLRGKSDGKIKNTKLKKN